MRCVLVTANDASQRLRISVATLYRLIRAGKVRTLRRGGRRLVLLWEVYLPGSEAPVYVASLDEAQQLR